MTTSKICISSNSGVPAGWDEIYLGDLFDFRNGLNKAKEFFGSGTPIVNYMDVFESSGLRAVDISGRVTLSPEEIERFNVRRGDVFFTRTSETVEDIGVAAVMLDNPLDTVFSGFVLRARPRTDRLDDRFKQYCFTLDSVRSQIVSNATYTTRALTNGNVLSSVKINVPPLPEQRAIAAALSDVDDLLDSLDALIAKKQAVKQATMQQLLTGRTRLPGFSGDFTQESLFATARDAQQDGTSSLRFFNANAPTPKGWKNATLGDTMTSQQGGTPSKGHNDYWGGEVPFVTAADLTEFRVGSKNSRSFLTTQGLNSGATAICEPGTLLLATRTRVGQVGIANELMGASQDITVLKPNGLVEPTLLYWILKYCATELQRNSRGTSIQGITRNDVDSLPIFLPTLPEQRAIANVLSDMYSEIEALERRRDKTEAIKQGMIQELLTGRIRLVEAR